MNIERMRIQKTQKKIQNAKNIGESEKKKFACVQKIESQNKMSKKYFVCEEKNTCNRYPILFSL